MPFFQTRIGVALGAAVTVLTFVAPAFADTGIALKPGSIRVNPGPGYTVVGMLMQGTHIEIDSCRPNWCYVSQPNGVDGWVRSQALGFVGPTGERTNMVHVPHFTP